MLAKLFLCTSCQSSTEIMNNDYFVQLTKLYEMRCGFIHSYI